MRNRSGANGLISHVLNEGVNLCEVCMLKRPCGEERLKTEREGENYEVDERNCVRGVKEYFGIKEL